MKKSKEREKASAAGWRSSGRTGNYDPLVFDESRRLWGAPSVRETDTCVFHVWRTLDNAYMVARVTCKLSDEHRFQAYRTEESEQFLGGLGSLEAWVAAGRPRVIVMHDVSIHTQENGRPKDYGNAFKAFEVVAEYHQEKHSPDSVKSNDDVTLAMAEKAGLASLPRLVAPSAPGARSRASSTAPLDAFGSRVGSGDAKINAVLTDKPKDMKQILKDAGLERTYYGHLKRMVEAGHVEKVKEGYKLKKK